MWFFFALNYSILMALIIIFDRYVVKNVFNRPIQGLFVTVPTSTLVIVALIPLITWPNNQVFLFAIIAGCLLQASQAFYFAAMEEAKQAGDLSALEASYPVLIAISSLFLGQYLNITQWLGILIVVVTVPMLAINRVEKPNFTFCIFIAFDILFLTLHGLLSNYSLTDVQFLSFFIPYNIGIVISGLAPFILFKKERYFLFMNWGNIRPLLPHLCLIEIGNILAIASAVYALSIGHPALVTCVMTTYPVIVILLTELLSKKYSNYGYQKNVLLKSKIFLALTMAIGLGLVAI